MQFDEINYFFGEVLGWILILMIGFESSETYCKPDPEPDQKQKVSDPEHWTRQVVVNPHQ